MSGDAVTRGPSRPPPPPDTPPPPPPDAPPPPVRARATPAPEARVRLLGARERLLRTLTGLADAAAASAPGRCPYRDRHDRCTFSAGCRNQRRDGAATRCGGGTLDTRPAVALAPAPPPRE